MQFHREGFGGQVRKVRQVRHGFFRFERFDGFFRFERFPLWAVFSVSSVLTDFPVLSESRIFRTFGGVRVRVGVHN